MAAMLNPRNRFQDYRFPLKNTTFDFGTIIGCVNNALTFYCCSHKYQFGEAGGIDILKHGNINKGAAIFTTLSRVLDFGLVCFFAWLRLCQDHVTCAQPVA